MEEFSSQAVFSAMQDGTPVATYRKTILGKVFVHFLNPFTNKPEATLLEGDPRNAEEAKIDVWSLQEDLFFQRMNKKHFDRGELLRIERKPVEVKKAEVKPIEQYSDEELKEILKLKPITFKKFLGEIKSPAVVMRLLDLASELDSSAKMIETITARLSALQNPEISE